MPPIARSPEFLIRPAMSQDADAIAELCNALADFSGEPGMKMDGAKVFADLLAPNSGLAVTVAERDETVVGYALHHVAYETAYAAKGRYLSDLFVAPEARRLGIATALMAAVAQQAADEGGEFVWWVEKNDAAAAQAFYAQATNVSVPVTAFAATEAHFKALLRRHAGGGTP